MSQDSMEPHVSMSNLLQARDSMTLRAEIPTIKRLASSSGKHITYVASDEMRITGSNEYTRPKDDNRMSWTKEDAEVNLHNSNPLYIDDNLHETQMELNSLNDEIITDEVELDRTNMDSTANNEIMYHRVETPPLSPATTRVMRGSKGIIKRSTENEVELEEIVLQAKEGVGDGADIGIRGVEGTNRLSKQAIKVSAILHSPQSPPSSPPREPLTSPKQSRKSIVLENKNNKDVDKDNDGDNTEDDIDGEDIEFAEEDVNHYDMEAYGNETSHIVDIEGGDVQVVEGVMGIASPKQDKMVLKEYIRVFALAVVAIIVVLVFVFT